MKRFGELEAVVAQFAGSMAVRDKGLLPQDVIEEQINLRRAVSSALKMFGISKNLVTLACDDEANRALSAVQVEMADLVKKVMTEQPIDRDIAFVGVGNTLPQMYAGLSCVSSTRIKGRLLGSARGGVGHHRGDLAEDRTDAAGDAGHNGTRRNRNKTNHQSVFDKILPPSVPPEPQQEKHSLSTDHFHFLLEVKCRSPSVRCDMIVIYCRGVRKCEQSRGWVKSNYCESHGISTALRRVPQGKRLQEPNPTPAVQVHPDRTEPPEHY